MKKIYIIIVLVAISFTSCKTAAPIAKSVAYKGLYDEKPLSLLIMPPINKSVNVEAKEYFHSTLYTPVANAGYYVIPPFLSMEILKKESAYDSEFFIDSPLNKFGEIFGVDIALFTIIHKWNKSSIASKVTVDVEYIIKSTKTNEILYSRRGEVVYSTSVSTGNVFGNIVGSLISTAATKFVDVAKDCNIYTFTDLPVGKYHQKNGIDGIELAGLKSFKVQLKAH
jgi:hypothetical protein